MLAPLLFVGVTTLAPVGVASLHLAPVGAIGVKLPDLGQLAQAVRSGDEVEIERVGARLGAVRLERVAEKGKREERLAALRALAVVDDAWAVLPLLSRLISDPDRDVADAAAVTARRVAEALTPERAERDEVPGDVPRSAGHALLEEAKKSELRPSVRVAAIAAAAALRGVVRAEESVVVALLKDEEPQVRRVAAESLAQPALADAPVVEALARALADDGASDVAAAAAASLCRDVPPVATAKNAAAERAGKLPQAARARLRTLALDESLSLADRLDLMGCLRVPSAPPSPDDGKTLDQLAKKGPDSIKRRARSLGGR